MTDEDAAKPPLIPLDLAPAAVEVEHAPDGAICLRSPQSLAPYEPHLGAMLRNAVARAPDRTLLAARDGTAWREVDYADALAAAEAIGQSLLERGLGPDRPVMVLSGNSIAHGLLMLGAFLAGVPLAPISPAYSLMSRDHGKLRHILDLVRPAMIFVEHATAYQAALASLATDGVELVTAGAPAEGLAATNFADLRATRAGDALRRAEAALGPASVAKYLFTSGSTGTPKAVINTHGMLCANQQMLQQCWPFVTQTPPVLVDWLPWNHTFGGNHNFNLVMKHGGTLYIDDGRPMPGAVEATVRNLADISPTIYINVPAGYAQLLPYLEADTGLRDRFFARLQMILYAGAALPQDLWDRLEALSIAALGRRVVMTSSWGSTETAPLATTAHFPIPRAGVIGLPVPGVEIKLVPAGGKQELRVKGPNVTPGYLNRPALTAAAFDADGFYRIGDAGRLADPADPTKGLEFDGRVAEDFKLATGTWVRVGALRIAALAAAAPVLQDAAVAGQDRDYVALLAWPNLTACKALCADQADPAELCRAPAVIAPIVAGLSRHNAANPGTSSQIRRVLVMATPPSIDADEITDKGYVNQRATLESRAELVERLYQEPPPADVIVID